MGQTESPLRSIAGDVLEDDLKQFVGSAGDSFWRRVAESLSIVEFHNHLDESVIEVALRTERRGKHAEKVAEYKLDRQKAAE